MSTTTTPEPEFPDNVAIREYCTKVRRILHVQSIELDIAASELEAALKEIPGNVLLLNSDSRVRARIVARHMRRSASAVRVASAGLVRTYASFRKHFMPELVAARAVRRVRKFHFQPE